MPHHSINCTTLLLQVILRLTTKLVSENRFASRSVITLELSFPIGTNVTNGQLVLELRPDAPFSPKPSTFLSHSNQLKPKCLVRKLFTCLAKSSSFKPNL